jgi:hypothetical protein
MFDISILEAIKHFSVVNAKQGTAAFFDATWTV